jgi:acetylornithine deacetylase/succinyl-diaminopimelate desuccinylase-like protein
MRRVGAAATALVAALAQIGAAAAAEPPRKIDPIAEAHEILLQLLAVDTSHGHETDALKPVAERFRAAGVPVEIVESEPGRGNLVARVRGSGARRPLLLVAHIDVVPVDGQPWTTPPFTPTMKEGHLYARGVGDDKSMAAAFVAIALEMARTKRAHGRDVIVALTAGEETGGAAGVRWLLAHRRELLDAEWALNEGGPMRLSADESRIEAMGIGVAEKVFQSFKLVTHGKGGHSSVPPTDDDPVVRLARGLIKVGELRFPARVLPAARASLTEAAGHEKGALAEALLRAGKGEAIRPADEAALHENPFYNALIRTTCVTTMLQGAPQDNVLPTTAEATVNCRMLPDETREATRARLIAAIADPALEVSFGADIGSGPMASMDAEPARVLTKLAKKRWPGVAVEPWFTTGATDSRSLRGAGTQAWGVACSPISIEDARKGRGAHGPDERRSPRWIDEGTRFLRDAVLELSK